MKKNLFELFIDKILSFPLWVKQIIYVRLAVDMKRNLCEEFIRTNVSKILALYSPTLTFEGRTELAEHNLGWDSNIYNFLQYCADDFTILDISISSYFSMEEVSKYFIFCLEQGYIEHPKSKEVNAMASFISGKIRIGEYFLERGLINEFQLNDALIEAEKTPEKLGEILLKKGYVAEKDLKSVVILKEEAKKRFIMDFSMLPKTIETVSYTSIEKDELSVLRDENKKLKLKLERLLSLVKKDEE